VFGNENLHLAIGFVLTVNTLIYINRWALYSLHIGRGMFLCSARCEFQSSLKLGQRLYFASNVKYVHLIHSFRFGFRVCTHACPVKFVLY